MSVQLIPGLCAVCALRTTETGLTFQVKEPLGSPYNAGWRTVTGPEVHEILRAWSINGSVYADGVRVTHPMLIDGEEYLPMLPVTMVNGAGVCASHIGCLLPRGETR